MTPRKHDDAAGITRNGLRVDVDKQRAWQRRGAVNYAAKRRTQPAPKRTPRRTANDWPRASSVIIEARSTGVCEVDGNQPADHKHHRKLRRHRDHRPCNALHVCTRCHDRIHRRIVVSLALGWLCKSGQNPAAEPVLYRGRRVLLDDNGGIHDLAGAGVNAPPFAKDGHDGRPLSAPAVPAPAPATTTGATP